MKLIGYWMMSLRDENLPLPQELVCEMPDSIREAVCNYLRNGRHFEGYLGRSWCRFHCGADDIEMGSREFTDGEWVWPEGLVHYVSSHGITLPEGFVARVTSSAPASKQRHRGTASLDYWIEWSSHRRSPIIREHLAKLLADARAAEPGLIDGLIQELAAREGESSEPCVFAGCPRPALIGCRICARHAFNERELKWRTDHLYMLPAPIWEP